MPYHDRNAYKEVDCYGGMTKADLGADHPPKAATFLRDEEVEAVVVYVATQLQGQGEPTKEDCIAFWGEGSKECEACAEQPCKRRGGPLPTRLVGPPPRMLLPVSPPTL